MDLTARLWRASDGAQLQRLNCSDWVWSAAFSPDGSTLITSDNDRFLKLWRASAKGSKTTSSSVTDTQGVAVFFYTVSSKRDGFGNYLYAKELIMRTTKVKRGDGCAVKAFLLPAILVLSTALTFSLGAATVTTDRLDYPPFSDVYIDGAGFQPGETVSVHTDQPNADGSRTAALQILRRMRRS